MRLFWLQGGGLAFAVVVALWSLRDTSGRDMAGLIARYATDSHSQTLTRQVAGLVDGARQRPTEKPAVSTATVREAGPVSVAEPAWKLAAAMAVPPAAPRPRVELGEFPLTTATAWRDWADRPPLPPPKAVG